MHVDKLGRSMPLSYQVVIERFSDDPGLSQRVGDFPVGCVSVTVGAVVVVSGASLRFSGSRTSSVATSFVDPGSPVLIVASFDDQRAMILGVSSFYLLNDELECADGDEASDERDDDFPPSHLLSVPF